MKNTAKKTSAKYDKFLIIIMLLAFAVYIKCLSFDILNFDDNEYFSDYPEINNLSLSSIIKYFSNYYVLMYQPLPILSFAILGNNATLQHFINLAFHIFNIFLVYRFCGLINTNKSVNRITTFLFALHPLAVEPVMWISSRSSVMYACFYILGLINYLNYRKSENKKNLYYSILFFILSLFSKVHAVSFPLSLIVIDLFILKQHLNLNLIAKKWIFFIGSLIFGFIALQNTETEINIKFSAGAYTYIDYIFIFCYEIIWYLVKIILPVNLSPIYVYPIKINGLLPYFYYVSAGIIILISYLFFKFKQKRDFILFGILFFYSSLIFVFQIVPSRLFIVADRYGYIANIGIFFIIAGLIFEYFEKTKALALFYTAASAIVIISFFQADIWKSDKTLADRIIDVNPETPYIARAFGIRANYYKNKENKTDFALSDYLKATELDSNDWISPYQAALIYTGNSELQQAILYYEKANKADNKTPLPYTDLGVLYTTSNDFIKAELCADSALHRSKYFANAMLLKSVCRLNMKDSVSAKNILNLCIDKNPKFSPAYKNRGIILLNNFKNKEDACNDFAKANELGEPDMQDILNFYCNKK